MVLRVDIPQVRRACNMHLQRIRNSFALANTRKLCRAALTVITGALCRGILLLLAISTLVLLLVKISCLGWLALGR